MQLTITEIHTTPQTITITKKEYNELKSKATKYDNLSHTHSNFIKSYNSKLTPEERKANARKAAKARWQNHTPSPQKETWTHKKIQEHWHNIERDAQDSINNLYGEPTIYEN